MPVMHDLKYTYPNYPRKIEFTPGTWGENDWQPGEVACVNRTFYRLPDDTEYAIFKFCERTHTGRKRLRWELWHNGRFSNNYFTCVEDVTRQIEDRISFFGFPGRISSYLVYPDLAPRK